MILYFTAAEFLERQASPAPFSLRKQSTSYIYDKSFSAMPHPAERTAKDTY